MKQRENVCLFNTFKSKKRQNIAYYSLPTNFYSDYRIFLPKGSMLEDWIKDKFDGDPIHLVSFLRENQKLLMGYYWFDRSNFSNSWLTYFQQKP